MRDRLRELERDLDEAIMRIDAMWPLVQACRQHLQQCVRCEAWFPPLAMYHISSTGLACAECFDREVQARQSEWHDRLAKELRE